MQYSKHHHVFWLKWVFVWHLQTLKWWCFVHCSLYTLTYFLTAWSRVILEKLTGSQPVKEFPAFYGTRMFITAFTSARHLSLSWASSIQSIPPHPTSWISILISSSHLCLGLPSGLYPSSFLPKHSIRLSSPPYVLHDLPILFSIWSPEKYLMSSTDH